MNYDEILNPSEAWKLDYDLFLNNGKIEKTDTTFKCLKPRVLPLQKNHKTKWKTVSFFRDIYPTNNHYQKAIVIKCGKCINCRKAQAFNWGKRIANEAWYQSYVNKRANIFLTLTYDDNHAIPRLFEIDGAYKPIVKLHMDKFIEKLKNKLRFYDKNGVRKHDKNINYFWVSELGSRTLRRHQHMIITGLPKWFVENKLNVGMSKYYNPLFTTEWLINNWGRGIINFGEVNTAAAMYLAQYCFKKNGFEFSYKCCSKNIGKNWYYHGMKTDKDNGEYHEPNSFILRLKKKALKDDKKYLDYLIWLENNEWNRSGIKPITIFDYHKNNICCNRQSIAQTSFTNYQNLSNQKRLEWMFGNKERDFNSLMDDNSFYLMRLKQKRNKRL